MVTKKDLNFITENFQKLIKSKKKILKELYLTWDIHLIRFPISIEDYLLKAKAN